MLDHKYKVNKSNLCSPLSSYYNKNYLMITTIINVIIGTFFYRIMNDLNVIKGLFHYSSIMAFCYYQFQLKLPSHH